MDAWLDPHSNDGPPARGQDATSDGVPSGSICCIVDNRAREVGFAVFEPASLRLQLVQYIETGRSIAATTGLLLEIHDVRDAVLMMPADQRQGGLSTVSPMVVATSGLSGQQHFLPRRAFDDTKALHALQLFATTDSWSKVAHATAAGSTTAGMYLAYAAAGALLEHLQASKHILMEGSVESLEILPQTSLGSTPLPPLAKQATHSQCFAVRKGADPFLEVARAAFTKITDKVQRVRLQAELVEALQRLAQDPRALGLALRINWLNTSSAPPDALQKMMGLVSGAGGLSLDVPQLADKYRLELDDANSSGAASRQHGAWAQARGGREAAPLYYKVLDGLVAHVGRHMRLLLRLVDSLALLDMLLAFGEVAGHAPAGRPYCRPLVLEGESQWSGRLWQG
ncbi:uncharacterized protein HaLaN_09571 [Haematococcus lacustris]|uniref:Uncharacterized protein n=1 Tax=Haematococcus lacustris TaxID=44745 RepID=A0A699ZDR6_HAELA|nr:uncharacterized protein HaLaN_09571 [Haematococcus lacustris]